MANTSFIAADWRIIATSPGGRDLSFVNDKTRENTWYTPEGVTAEEILEIPDAKKHWSTKEDVEKYIKQMEVEKAKYGSS